MPATQKTESKPLAGRHIAVTRAPHQAPALAELIREFGGVALDYPCIDIEPPPDPRPLQRELKRPERFDWLLLTSGNAVRAVAQLLPAGDLPARIAAAGPATAQAVRERLNREVDYMPARPGAGQLARGLPLGAPCRILLPQSNLAFPATAETLRARGADVTAALAYKTVIGSGGVDLPALIEQGAVDALSFTSPSAVQFFTRRCPAQAAKRLPALCIGEATASAASECGFGMVLRPATPDLRAMLLALVRHSDE